jgi:RNA polymerase sigma factor (sigma-70 family)
MSDTTRSRLKSLFTLRYAHLRRRLEYIVGSKDGAADALQETWLRLDTMSEPAAVANADAYLLRIAANVAIDQHRDEQRHLNEGEIDEMFEVQDELVDPERVVSARREVETLQDVVRTLTPRQQAILLAARVEGQLNREIAERFGISESLVEKELRLALRHCKASMRETTAFYGGDTIGRRKF